MMFFVDKLIQMLCLCFLHNQRKNRFFLIISLSTLIAITTSAKLRTKTSSIDESSHHSFKEGSSSKHSLLDGIWNLNSMSQKSSDGSTRWKIERKINRIGKNRSRKSNSGTKSFAVKKEIQNDGKNKNFLYKKSKKKHLSFKKVLKNKIFGKSGQSSSAAVKNTENEEEKSPEVDDFDKESIKSDAVTLSKFDKKKHPNIIKAGKKSKESGRKSSSFNTFEKKNVRKITDSRFPFFDKVVQDRSNRSSFDQIQDDYNAVDEEKDWKDAIESKETDPLRKASTHHIVFSERVAEENSTSSNKNGTTDTKNLSNNTSNNKTKEENSTSSKNNTITETKKLSNNASRNQTKEENSTSNGVDATANVTSLSNETQSNKTKEGPSCKYKIWYVGNCHENGTEIVHLILSKGEINCTVSKQIIQECEFVANKSKVKVPSDAPMKAFLENGNHTIEGVDQILKNKTQTPLSGIFHIDKPVNVHINVINAAEKEILKDLKEFDSEAKDRNSTNATVFVEVNNVTNILLNNTLDKLNETLDRIEETVKNNTRLKADRTIQVRIDDKLQKDSEEEEFKQSEMKNITKHPEDLIFKGRSTKDSIVANKTKETIDGKTVNVEQKDPLKDILKEEKPKLLSSNIVLPDTTNSNTHVVDTFLNPEEERNESNRRSHKSGFMHAMKKHRNKQPEISNISAEKVTSESSTQNETSLEIAEAPDEKNQSSLTDSSNFTNQMQVKNTTETSLKAADNSNDTDEIVVSSRAIDMTKLKSIEKTKMPSKSVSIPSLGEKSKRFDFNSIKHKKLGPKPLKSKTASARSLIKTMKGTTISPSTVPPPSTTILIKTNLTTMNITTPTTTMAQLSNTTGSAKDDLTTIQTTTPSTTTSLPKVDCQLSEWKEMIGCSKTCGNATKTMYREILVEASNGGKDCGLMTNTTNCNLDSCSVDCKLSDWDEWSSCSRSCERGSRSRNRTILVSPENEGQQCGSTFDIMDCNENPCPVDCEMTDWSEWNTCTKSCGDGTKSRVRSISIEPAFNGTKCNSTIDTADCLTRPCPVDCLLSEWESWSVCSKSCGNGTTARVRNILRDPRDGGGVCNKTIQTKECNVEECPVDCKLSDWGDWSTCSVTCGKGSTNRSRRILTESKNGGKTCDSPNERKECNIKPCPVDCIVSEWESWTECSKSCGNGTKSRTRQVLVQAANHGRQCSSLLESISCNRTICPEVSQNETFRLLRTEKCCKDKTVPKVCLGLCKSQNDNPGNRIGKSVFGISNLGRCSKYMEAIQSCKNRGSGEKDELEENILDKTLNDTTTTNKAPSNGTNFDPPPLNVSKQLLQKNLSASSNDVINSNQTQNKDIVADALANISSILNSKKPSESNLNDTKSIYKAPSNGSNLSPTPLDVSNEFLQNNMNTSSNDVTNVNQSLNKGSVAETLANITNILNSEKQSESNNKRQLNTTTPDSGNNQSDANGPVSTSPEHILSMVKTIIESNDAERKTASNITDISTQNLTKSIQKQGHNKDSPMQTSNFTKSGKHTSKHTMESFSSKRGSLQGLQRKEIARKSIQRVKQETSHLSNMEIPSTRRVHLKNDNIKNVLNGENHAPVNQQKDDSKRSNEEKHMNRNENGSVIKETADEQLNSVITKNHHNLHTSNRNRNSESLSNAFRTHHRHHTKQGSMKEYRTLKATNRNRKVSENIPFTVDVSHSSENNAIEKQKYDNEDILNALIKAWKSDHEDKELQNDFRRSHDSDFRLGNLYRTYSKTTRKHKTTSFINLSIKNVPGGEQTIIIL